MADLGYRAVLCNFTTLLDIAAARPDVSFVDLCENNLYLVMTSSNIKVQTAMRMSIFNINKFS
jgi:hypothetical protein